MRCERRWFVNIRNSSTILCEKWRPGAQILVAGTPTTVIISIFVFVSRYIFRAGNVSPNTTNVVVVVLVVIRFSIP